MSNALAIAAVTAVLRDLLNNGLIDHDVTGSLGGNVTVSALPPDRIQTGDSSEQAQLNLFLYQVSPNAGWRNVGLPSRSSNGDRLSNPPLALDLHYLLTVYGAQEFHGEVLLGYAMQILHETPVLARDAIRESLAAPPPISGGVLPPAQQALVAAELADQVELIKIVPQALNLEELSKLWTAMQAKYRPSAAYQASVVLIESKRSTRPALPVRTRNVKVFTWRQPVIEQVVSSEGADAWIFEGSTLLVQGYQLKGNVTQVRFGEVDVTPADTDLTDSEIRVAVPAGLQAGVQSVQVVQRLDLGTAAPSEPHRGFESNVMAFILHPVIEASGPVPPAVIGPTVANVTPTLVDGTPVIVDGVTLQSADVTVNFAPRVGRSQRVRLLLNEFNPPASRQARAYSFNAPQDNGIADPLQADTGSIVFPISFVAPADYLVRVQVDGAESPLTVDGTGQYALPRITV
ncbi:MAG: DUF4255 domain-containing protein [Chloroflexota bacterium]|nr:DUF4255 domain-containing protein [Chloroflexota bacterium]